jgi:predicted negative regulator of RcsB-dependent stress response
MTDDDRVAAIRRWWEENGTALVVSLVLVVAGIVGWRWYVDADRAKHEAASTLYQRYLDLQQAGSSDTEAIATTLESLDREYAGTAYQTFTLFYRAADAIDREDYAEGEKWLRQALSGAKDEGLRDLARVRLARVLHQVDRDDEALEMLTGTKGAGFRSYAAELKGDILLAQGKRDEALDAYHAAAELAGPDGGRPLLDLKIADLTVAGGTGKDGGARADADAAAGEQDAPAS